MKSLIAFSIALGILLSPMAHPQQATFVRDSAKPYIYLQFDHVGKRKPIQVGESNQGLWLRFVNNSNVPVKVGSFDPGSDDPGTGLISEVIPYKGLGAYSSPKNLPPGYESEVYSLMSVQPGESILFSVPKEYVSELWYLRIRFTLSVGQDSVQQPYSFVEFREEMLHTDRDRKHTGL